MRNLEKNVEGLIHLGRKSETPFDPAVFFSAGRETDVLFNVRKLRVF